ncbi:MAG: hypothetical protein ACR2KZ_11885 [Segetibacter sp.]
MFRRDFSTIKISKKKNGDAKTKVEEDGTIKVKDGDFRSKKDKAGNMRVKDDSAKVKIIQTEV